jgi:hypothetical protein
MAGRWVQQQQQQQQSAAPQDDNRQQRKGFEEGDMSDSALFVLQIDAKRSLPHGQHSSPKSKKIFVGGLAPETNEGTQTLAAVTTQ